MGRKTFRLSVLLWVLLHAGTAHAQQGMANQCSTLPNHGTLKAALDKATAEEKSGLNNHMWATVVDRDGVVCAVAFSGTDRASQWPISRVISAQKANTAAALALDSTSNSAGSGAAKAPASTARARATARSRGWRIGVRG